MANKKQGAVRVCGWCAGAPLTSEGAAGHTRCFASEGANKCACAHADHALTPELRTVQSRVTGLTVEECIEADAGLTPAQASEVRELHNKENGERAAAFVKVYVGALPLRLLHERLVEWAEVAPATAKRMNRTKAEAKLVAVIIQRKEARAMQTKKNTAKKNTTTKGTNTMQTTDNTGVGRVARGNGMPNEELIAWIKANAPKATSRGNLFKMFRGEGRSANDRRFAAAVEVAGVTFGEVPAAKAPAAKKAPVKATAKKAPAKAVAKKAPAKKATAKKAAPRKTAAKK